LREQPCLPTSSTCGSQIDIIASLHDPVFLNSRHIYAKLS